MEEKNWHMDDRALERDETEGDEMRWDDVEWGRHPVGVQIV